MMFWERAVSWSHTSQIPKLPAGIDYVPYTLLRLIREH